MRSVSTILIHHSELLAKGVQKVLSKSRFKPVHMAGSYEEVPDKFLDDDNKVLFVVGEDRLPILVETIGRIRRRARHSFIVVLQQSSDKASGLSVVEAGANGVFVDTITSDAFLRALEVVLAGEVVLPRDVVSELSRRADSFRTVLSSANFTHCNPELHNRKVRLSAQEDAILRCLIKGSSNKVIARELGISEATVKAHVKAILRKVGLSNRTQAAVWAVERDLRQISQIAAN